MSQHPPAVELTDADELAHPPGDERLWGESWYFDFTDRDGTLGGYVRLGLYPNLGVAWYWACLVGEGRPLVTVIDHEVALPKAPSLEIRADGLWADHIVETPFDHMTLGCEAFAISVDDPAEVYGDLRGDRVPVRLRPRVGDRPRRAVPVDRHHPLRGVVQRARRDPRRRRDHRLRRHRPARPQLGRARLVEPRLGVDRRRPRGRHPLPHRPDPRARHGRRSPPATCCRPDGGVRADRRVHRPARSSASTGSPPAARSPAARSSWPSSRATSARSTWSTRRPTAPATPGSRGRCAASRPPTDAPASAGRSGTNRSTETVPPIRSPGGHSPSTSVGEAATSVSEPSFSLLPRARMPGRRARSSTCSHATAAAPPRRGRPRRRHACSPTRASSARSTPSPPGSSHAGVGRGRPGRRAHGVGSATSSTSRSSRCSAREPPTCPSTPTIPEERADLVFGEAGVALVLTDGTALDEPDGPRRPAGPRRSTTTRGSSSRPARPACPKGVAVTHRGRRGVRRRRGRAVRARRAARARATACSPGSRWRSTPRCEEMWLAWRHGACLVPAPRALVRTGHGPRAVAGRPAASPSCRRCPPSPGCGPPTRSTRCAC